MRQPHFRLTLSNKPGGNPARLLRSTESCRSSDLFPGRKSYEPITVTLDIRIAGDGKSAGPLFGERCECGLEVVLGAGFYDNQFRPSTCAAACASLVSISASGLVGLARIPIVETFGTI